MPLVRENSLVEHSQETHAQAVNTLEQVVENSADPDGQLHPHTPAAEVPVTWATRHPWLASIIPTLERFGAREHLGNFVMSRGKDAKETWEGMPIYVRLGMHALFVSSNSYHLTSNKRVEDILTAQSIKEGKIYDAEEGATAKIESFVKTYSLEDTLPELLLPDLADYPTFNSFFYRKLKPDARPCASPDDPNVIVSAADCRLTVYESVDDAREFWVKGQNFNLKNLFQDEALSGHAAFKDGAALAIFRLAPQDYHRWHMPCTAKMGEIKSIPGQLYTVNPQAINEDLDVFTENKRDVVLLTRPEDESRPVVLVAVGAMLVGSINWCAKAGDTVKKGLEQGYFAYGGSTVICCFPTGTKFDDDLVANSKRSLETVVQVGERIGVFQ